MPDGINDALLIYNPTSGRKRHRRFVEVEQAARILKDSGISTEFASTTARASATTIARQAVEQRRGMVIVCGGDGTINEVVNGLAGSRVPMALLPAGTANILAKELGIPWDIPLAARLIPDGYKDEIAMANASCRLLRGLIPALEALSGTSRADLGCDHYRYSQPTTDDIIEGLRVPLTKTEPAA